MCRESEIGEGAASCALQAQGDTHGIAGRGSIDRGVVHGTIDGSRPSKVATRRVMGRTIVQRIMKVLECWSDG